MSSTNTRRDQGTLGFSDCFQLLALTHACTRTLIQKPQPSFFSVIISDTDKCVLDGGG